MKIILSLLVILHFIVSCNNPKSENKKITELTNNSYQWNSPDENATISSIYTKTTIDDNDLILKLKLEFKKDEFKIEKIEFMEENTYNNCDDNLILKITGKGIKKYYVKRQEAKPKNHYPDLVMWIYEFETESETVAVEKEIRKAFDSGNSFCNGKSPEYIVRYKNKIIHLGTRAEMFRDYVKTYGEKIKQFNNF